MVKTPENPAEDAKDAAGVSFGHRKTAQEEAQAAAVGFAHGGRRVAGGCHGPLDHFRQKIQSAGGDE